MKKVYLKILGVIAVLAINVLTLHVAYANLQNTDYVTIRTKVYQHHHLGKDCPSIREGWYHAVCALFETDKGLCYHSRCGLLQLTKENSSTSKNHN